MSHADALNRLSLPEVHLLVSIPLPGELLLLTTYSSTESAPVTAADIKAMTHS